LLVDGDRIRITRGPKEHHTRPAIDPLFRSLAMHAGARAVGVVLTGQLDDGTSGLQAIKASGGRAVVQDPDDAVAPDMPTSACRFVRVDHCVPLDAMAGLLDDLSRQPVPAAPFEPIDTPQNHEQAVFLSDGDPMDHLKLIGMPSTFTCPDCHGALWQVLDSAPLRYRCHTGHGFTLASLQAAQSEVTGDSLWNALRGLAERYMLLDELAGWERLQGDTVRAARTQAAASRAKEMAAAVRLMIETDDVDAIETAD
jgi:two-component system chemotaxis response regulator CheB